MTTPSDIQQDIEPKAIVDEALGNCAREGHFAQVRVRMVGNLSYNTPGFHDKSFRRSSKDIDFKAEGNQPLGQHRYGMNSTHASMGCGTVASII